MSSPAAVLPTHVRRAAGWISVARDRLLAVRPLYVLSTLLAVQWAALAALAVTVRHNGWVYYMGGDQLWHYSSAYLLAHGELPPTYVGVGWSTLLAPISWIAGPDLVSAVPFIIVFNALVLVPLATLCLYGIAARIGGRLFGYWAALLWIVLPYAGIRYALTGYHQKYTELTLPQILGLGAMSDFPSVVALLVGAYLCLRAVDSGHWLWGAGAGFATGYALAIKPSNTVFLIAPALLFLVFRRRTLIPFILGLGPPLLLLAVWKERGYGHIPLFAAPPPTHRVALGIGDVLHPWSRYTGTNSWTQLHNNLIQLREQLWSDRVLEFLAIGGIVALVIRSRRAGLFVGSWFLAFLLLKGTYINARVEDGSFWRLLLPAFPAFVVMVAAIPLLLPGLRLRPTRPTPIRLPRRLVAGAVAGLVLVLVLLPVTVIAGAKPSRQPNVGALELNATLVPVSGVFRLHAKQENGRVTLTWNAERPSGGDVFYRVFRTESPAGTDGTVCAGVPRNVPDQCTLAANTQSVGTTRRSTLEDMPGPGRWAYRIGLSANWLDDPNFGDVYVFSRPVTIKVP
ncbi:MAG: hypothetical protein WAQ33_11085 [Gaiellaceae bacterium]